MHEFLAREREFFEGEVALFQMQPIPYNVLNNWPAERPDNVTPGPGIERPERNDTPGNVLRERLDIELPEEFARNREEFDEDATTYNSDWEDFDRGMRDEIPDTPRSPSPQVSEPENATAPVDRKPETCNICREDLMANRPTATICGHVYCRSCMRRWVIQNQSCPSCRMPQSFNQCIELHY